MPSFITGLDYEIEIKKHLVAFTERHYRVVDATQALSGLPVTVADGVGVDVVVAVALLARTHWTELSHRVAEVPVLAELAPGTGPTGGALDTDRGIRVSGNFEAGAAVRAGAGLAVVGGSDQRVAVEALGAPLAVVAVGVVEAGALACDGIDRDYWLAIHRNNRGCCFNIDKQTLAPKVLDYD